MLGLIPGLGRFPWSRKWQPTPVFLPGKFHKQRSLAGYSPRGHKELDTTEHLKLNCFFHFQLDFNLNCEKGLDWPQFWTI